jgi:hypothetical protein
VKPARSARRWDASLFAFRQQLESLEAEVGQRPYGEHSDRERADPAAARRRRDPVTHGPGAGV